jgi:hypothetical protein
MLVTKHMDVSICDAFLVMVVDFMLYDPLTGSRVLYFVVVLENQSSGRVVNLIKTRSLIFIPLRYISTTI